MSNARGSFTARYSAGKSNSFQRCPIIARGGRFSGSAHRPNNRSEKPRGKRGLVSMLLRFDCLMLKPTLHLSEKARRRIAGFHRLIEDARVTARLYRKAADRNGFASSLNSREAPIRPAQEK
jgi:hypothetical protein